MTDTPPVVVTVAGKPRTVVRLTAGMLTEWMLRRVSGKKVVQVRLDTSTEVERTRCGKLTLPDGHYGTRTKGGYAVKRGSAPGSQQGIPHREWGSRRPAIRASQEHALSLIATLSLWMNVYEGR